jgi:hypothetical protein
VELLPYCIECQAYVTFSNVITSYAVSFVYFFKSWPMAKFNDEQLNKCIIKDRLYGRICLDKQINHGL